MRHFFIISGGKTDDAFAYSILQQEKPETIIAADSGMEFLYRNGIKPQIIVGDFDSVGSEALSYYRTQPDIEIRELNPVKDDTDTEFAIRLALELGAEKITLLGATGTRLDHVLGNIELLGIGMEKNVPMTILDAHNRIRMICRGITLTSETQFGNYVSLIPYTEKVDHLYLKGFKYPLLDACLQRFSSLGISNEIVDKEATISFDSGILLVIESRD